MQIKAKLSFTNNIMVKWRKDRGHTQVVAAGLAGVPLFCWQLLERLHFPTYRKANAIAKIADMLNVSVDDIMPPGLEGKSFSPAERYFDIPALALKSYIDRSLLPSPDVVFEAKELNGLVASAIEELPFREREILKLRFGLDGKPPLTLLECGKVFKVTGERVGMVEAKAIRSLRNKHGLLGNYIEEEKGKT